MATIVTRSGKGSPLTHNEVDANFTNLNNDKVETSALSELIDDRVAALVVAGTNMTVTYNDGAGTLTFDAAGGGGISDGDKGDITVSGSGATWMIDNGVVSLAKMADMATSSLIYRKTAGSGAPEVNTLATLKTDLGLTGTNSGDQTSIVGITGTKAQFDTAVTDGNFLYVGDVTSNATHTGDVTGATALTIDPTAITGKTTVTADAADYVLISDTSDSGNLKKALVSDFGGGGGGSGDVVGPASATDNAIARYDGTTGKLIQNSGATIDDNGAISLPNVASPPAPAAGFTNLFGSQFAGALTRPGYRNDLGVSPRFMQEDLSSGVVALFLPAGGTTTSLVGWVTGSVGTATTANIASGSVRGRIQRIEYRVTTASTTAVANFRHTSLRWSVGGASSWEGGFKYSAIWGTATGATNANHRGRCGLWATGAAASDTNPSTATDWVGMGWDTGDTNVQMMHNDGTGTCTKIDLGASFPRPSVDQGDTYKLEMYSPPGTTQIVYYSITRLESGAVATGSITTNLPATSAILTHQCAMSVGGTSSVVGIMVGTTYIHSEFG